MLGNEHDDSLRLVGADYDADALSPSTRIVDKLHHYYVFASLLVSFALIFISEGTAYNWIGLSINIILSYYFVELDRKHLCSAGYDNPPKQIWWLFMPAYVWKRCTVTGKSRSVFYSYMLASFLVLGVSWWHKYANDNSGIAEVACNVVTKISVQSNGLDAPVCQQVILGESTSDNNWNAIARMDNGTTRHLSVNYSPDTNNVSVKLATYTGYIN